MFLFSFSVSLYHSISHFIFLCLILLLFKYHFFAVCSFHSLLCICVGKFFIQVYFIFSSILIPCLLHPQLPCLLVLCPFEACCHQDTWLPWLHTSLYTSVTSTKAICTVPAMMISNTASFLKHVPRSSSLTALRLILRHSFSPPKKLVSCFLVPHIFLHPSAMIHTGRIGRGAESWLQFQ